MLAEFDGVLFVTMLYPWGYLVFGSALYQSRRTHELIRTKLVLDKTFVIVSVSGVKIEFRCIMSLNATFFFDFDETSISISPAVAVSTTAYFQTVQMFLYTPHSHNSMCARKQ